MPKNQAPAWLFSPLAQTRWSTLLCALAVLGVVSWRRRNPLLGVVAVLAWLGAYEVAFNGLGAALFDWPASAFIWGAAAVLGWTALAGFLGIWPEPRIVLLYAATMAVWVALGFHSNTATRVPFSASGEILNELSKTLLAAAYLVGALRSGSQRGELVQPLAVDIRVVTSN